MDLMIAFMIGTGIFLVIGTAVELRKSHKAKQAKPMAVFNKR